jgi:hypothetical protein
LEGDLLIGLVVGAADVFLEECEEPLAFSFVDFVNVVVELAISGVEEKVSIRKGPLFFRGICSEKKVSLHGVGKSFVGSHIFPTWLPYFV